MINTTDETNMTRMIDGLLCSISARGRIWIEDNRLWVSPPALASLYAERIKKLKPEILLVFARCPTCVELLEVKIENIAPEKIRIHTYCPASAWHYDKWER